MFRLSGDYVPEGGKPMLKQMNEDWMGTAPIYGVGDLDKMGTVLAASMPTILCGYTIKLVPVALARD